MVDCFATKLNHKLPNYVSLVPEVRLGKQTHWTSLGKVCTAMCSVQWPWFHRWFKRWSSTGAESSWLHQGGRDVFWFGIVWKSLVGEPVWIESSCLASGISHEYSGEFSEVVVSELRNLRGSTLENLWIKVIILRSGVKRSICTSQTPLFQM